MKNKNKAIIYVVLIVMSFIMLVPFAWMVLTAFKTVCESTQMDPFVILPSSRQEIREDYQAVAVACDG